MKFLPKNTNTLMSDLKSPKRSDISVFVALLITISFVGNSLLVPLSASALTQEAVKKNQTIDDIFRDPKMQRDVAGIVVSCVASAYLPDVIDTIANGSKFVVKSLGFLSKVEETKTAVATVGTTVVPDAALGNSQQKASEAAAAAALVASPAGVHVASVPISLMLKAINLGIDGLHYTTKAGVSSIIGTNKEQKAKDTITDCLVYSAGQLLLKQLTQDTVNWIKGGFHGSPSFAVDTHEIFLDLADMVAGDLAREIRGIAMCKFRANFQNDLANNIELSAKHIYKFNSATKCPFPETFNINSSDFYKGVNQFSWGAMEYAMQDRGNPFGVALLSGQELALRSSEKKDVQKQELSWSNGFTNMVDTENCNYPSGYGTANGHLYYNSLSPDMEEAFSNSIANDPKLTNQERSAKMDSIYVDHTTKLSSKEVAALQKTYCPTTTPGKIIGDQLTKATGIDMERLGLVDSITKIIGALIERATQSAAEGIFKVVSGQSDAKAQQNSITVQDKTAETIMMENYAIKNAKDTLATAQQNLANARADGSTSPETIYLLQQAVGNAQKHIDEVTSVENTIARQIELNAANTEVTNALAAERIAQAQADAASKAYYTALQGTLDGGTYIQPDPANLADLKAQMDNADNELVKAQGVTANARQRLYDAEHPVN